METYAFEIDIPDDDVSKKKESCPMILFLHGAGERGGDRQQQVRKHGPWKRLIPEDRVVEKEEWTDRNSQANSYIKKFFVVAPHLSSKSEHWDVRKLKVLIDDVIKCYPQIDPKQIHLTGISLGGLGAMQLALLHREFASLVIFCPVSGNLEAAKIREISHITTLAFHHENDQTVQLADCDKLYHAMGQFENFLFIRMEKEEPLIAIKGKTLQPLNR